MALILSIETATNICSVALHDNGKLVSLAETNEDKSHSNLLLPFIDKCLTEAKKEKQDLSAIAVSEGPGSYTGLRIGLSSAKGLCYALDIPLIAINTLDALALQVSKSLDDNGIACPMIDARRMEVYTSLYTGTHETILAPCAKIIDETAILELSIKNKTTFFFGNGASKCQSLLPTESYSFVPDIVPSASTVGELAFKAFQNQTFVDTAYFEPNYLKEFYSPPPTKNKSLQHLVKRK